MKREPGERRSRWASVMSAVRSARRDSTDDEAAAVQRDWHVPSLDDLRASWL